MLHAIQRDCLAHYLNFIHAHTSSLIQHTPRPPPLMLCSACQLPLSSVRPPVEEDSGYTGVAAPKRKRVQETPVVDEAPPKVCNMSQFLHSTCSHQLLVQAACSQIVSCLPCCGDEFREVFWPHDGRGVWPCGLPGHACWMLQQLRPALGLEHLEKLLSSMQGASGCGTGTCRKLQL